MRQYYYYLTNKPFCFSLQLFVFPLFVALRKKAQ